MLKMSFFHINSRAETFAPLINRVIDDALFETTPDIDQALLQFIDVMNLPNPLMHFSHIFCSQLNSYLWCWVAKGLVK